MSRGEEVRKDQTEEKNRRRLTAEGAEGDADRTEIKYCLKWTKVLKEIRCAVLKYELQNKKYNLEKEKGVETNEINPL